MPTGEFEARFLAWARSQAGLEAVVQIGSRVQAGGRVDQWSDWDYQLVVKRPADYHNRDWLGAIAPCWCAHIERTERDAVKVSAVFEGGIEADFVLLAAWQIRLVCRAMRWPWMLRVFPPALARGVYYVRLVGAPGHRVLLGGEAWERRLAPLAEPWSPPPLTEEKFRHHVAACWRHAVWVAKKTARGELRAALRWHQAELIDHVYALLAEEAAGRGARPEAREAERWLAPERVAQTQFRLAPGREAMAAALLATINLFTAAAAAVAARRGFAVPDHAAIESWLRAELAPLAGGSSAFSSGPETRG